MGTQLDLLAYREPVRLRAYARDATLVLEAHGDARAEALDALVDCINHLDGRGVPVLGQLAGVARFPVDRGRYYAFGYPLRSTTRAAEAVALAATWWDTRRKGAA